MTQPVRPVIVHELRAVCGRFRTVRGMTFADSKRLAYVGKAPGAASRDSDSWFTPPVYVEAARACLGGIGLDPFSSAAANLSVKAGRFLTVADDALTCAWRPPSDCRTVWMNPPYSGGLCRLACAKFLEEFAAGSFSAGVVLVNNATETRFFQALLGASAAMCLPSARIQFWNADGKQISGNTRGQAFLYFGDDAPRFLAAFKSFGWVGSF